jgi:serine protease AprX
MKNNVPSNFYLTSGVRRGCLFSLVFALTLIVNLAFTQTAPGKYWVQFSDKNNSPYSIENLEEVFSERSYERRIAQGIGFDELDLPVNEHYIQEVLEVCNCQLHNKSKWFNAITINLADSVVAQSIAQLPFVLNVKSVKRLQKEQNESDKLGIQKSNLPKTNTAGCAGFLPYGQGFRQIEMLNGHLVHALGYTGDGVTIAQFDSGWNLTDQLPAFEHLRSEGKIAMVRDFVFGPAGNVYALSNHGTFVLSTMGAFWPDSLIGTGYDATYYLFRTEDPLSENLVEEDNWVAAAELADSLGIDIINSSLGYSLFDSASMNHSYADMDGNTTRCSIAADIASAKGILVVNSAGNSGNSAWRFITAPSDGDEVLCIGSVNADEIKSSFSGFGPSADGDVKPNVAAMGEATSYAALDSTVRTGNGTSFSSPIIAGMAACLFQAFPGASARQVKLAIEMSASDYLNPDDSLGYGIPDFMRAHQILQNNMAESASKGDFDVSLYPNPCNDEMTVILRDAPYCDVAYEIYDAAGRRIFESIGVTQDNDYGIIRFSGLDQLNAGHYTLHLGRAGKHAVLNFVKK